MKSHNCALTFTIAILFTNVHATEERNLCLGDCVMDHHNGLKTCTFNATVDLSAGELGYYGFDQCDGVNPTLGLQKGVNYIFRQNDYTNYYHPFGFSCKVDGGGDHGNHGGHGGHGGECGFLTPTYKVCGGNHTGHGGGGHGNKGGGSMEMDMDMCEMKDMTTYIDMFKDDPKTWKSASYEVNFTIPDDNDYMMDIFYHCHIHNNMTGRIKFVGSDGKALNDMDMPTIPYEYDSPGSYDTTCGTYGLDAFQLPHPECPQKFVCGEPKGNIGVFADCLESMNCAMTVGMTTNVHQDSHLALFAHQMIPHHQNAVNMCKAMFKTITADQDCTNIEHDSPQCVMKRMCLEIINNQNHQIQVMRKVLQDLDYEQEDDCKVPINSNATCINDPTFTFKLINMGTDQKCGWITENKNVATRRETYCRGTNMAAIATACPQACGTCVADDPLFRFQLKKIKTFVDCKWLTKNPNKITIRKNYCKRPNVAAGCAATCM